jgi:hypothetical protein
MRGQRCWLRAIVGLLCLLGVTEARAAPVQFTLTGRVTDIPVNDTSLVVSPGDPILGSYTFESTTPDGAASATEGSYTAPSGAPYGLSVTIGGNPFSTQDFLNIGIANFGLLGDTYTVLACSPDVGCTDLELEIALRDIDGTAFSSDALPLTPPLLGLFEIRTFHVFALLVGNELQIEGAIDTLNCPTCAPTPIPEPGTLGLMVAGLVLCGLYHRHRTTTRRRAS